MCGGIHRTVCCYVIAVKCAASHIYSCAQKLRRTLEFLRLPAYAYWILLKGALLFTLWYEIQYRVIQDADFLGLGAI